RRQAAPIIRAVLYTLPRNSGQLSLIPIPLECRTLHGGHMQDTILAYGPPPLTQQAADAALDTIDFIAAAIRGYDAIDVTNVVRPIWRTHLAYYYPSLPFEMRQWYANAPMMAATINAQWPMLDPMQRSMVLQQWSVELPYMLWMLDPVMAEAQNLELHEATRE